jgi:hypothetical protein
MLVKVMQLMIMLVFILVGIASEQKETTKQNKKC